MSRSLTIIAACAMLLGASATLRAQTPAATAPSSASEAQAQTVVLRLANNTLLVGTIVREEADSIVFDAGSLGQITIRRSDIVAQLEPSTIAAAFQAPPQATAAQAPTSGLSAFAPEGRVVWTRFVTFGGSFTSAPFKQGQLDPAIPGVTGELLRLPGKQYVAQAQLTLVRAQGPGIFFVDSSLNYAQFEPFGKQTDFPKISTGYNFRLRQDARMFGVTRYTWYRDRIRQVDYSNQALFGVGFSAVSTPRIKLDVAPGLTMLREEKGTPLDNQWEAGWGFLQQLTFSPHQFAQIEQREMFYQLFGESDYRGLESYIGFRGMLSRALGVQFGFSHIYDGAIAQRPTVIPANALFPGQPQFSLLANEKTQVLLTAGVLVRF